MARPTQASSPFAQLSPYVQSDAPRKCLFRVYLDAKRFKTVSLKLPATFGELRVAVAEKCRELDSSTFAICAEQASTEIEPLSGFPASWDIGSLIYHWDATYRLMFKPPSSLTPSSKQAIIDSCHYPAVILDRLFQDDAVAPTRYRLAICVKEGVAPWPPAYPQVSWFPSDQRFKTFLLDKLIGGQYGCHFSPLWTARFGRSRKLSLDELNPFLPH